MANLIVVDTETPGFAKPLRPLEVATILLVGDSPQDMEHVSRTYDRFYCPAEIFEYGAMAVHSILPMDVEECPPWDPHKFREQHLGGVDYLIGHNVDFDWEAIGSPDIKRICTLAIARFYWPDLDAHKLGAMIYYTFGPNSETRQWLLEAHSAEADANNTLRFLGSVVESRGIKTWEEAHRISEMGRVPYRMGFGKHGPKDGKKGMIIADMIKQDPGYVRWMKQNMTDMDPYLRKALDSPRTR